MKHVSLFMLALFTPRPIGPLLAKNPALYPPSAQTDSTPVVVLPALLSVDSLPTTASLPNRYDASPPLTGADTQRVTARQQAQIHKIVPRRATIRSLMLPGLGQVYNRQYWKVPVIYAGFGIAVFFFTTNQNSYTQYITSYREAYRSPAINPFLGTKTAVVQGTIRTVDYLKRATAYYGRQRDLTVILTVAGWLLNAVEANVAAHLKTFDISEDLSMQVRPGVWSLPETGLVPGVRVTFVVNRRVSRYFAYSLPKRTGHKSAALPVRYWYVCALSINPTRLP